MERQLRDQAGESQNSLAAASVECPLWHTPEMTVMNVAEVTFGGLGHGDDDSGGHTTS